MKLLLMAAAGGAIGSGARYLVSLACLRCTGSTFPWGTLTVNIVGCLMMGLVTELVLRRLNGSPEMRVFLATGILGGFTTFSAFALDFANLMRGDGAASAFIYASASIVVSILAVYAGLSIGRQVF